VNARNGDDGGVSVDRLEPRRVLVVDDDHDAADILVMLVECLCAEAQAAYSGAAALELLAEFRPHLVLLDIDMPAMDGYETARRIRARTEGQELLLAALTGWGRTEDQRFAFEAGFDAHFAKPMRIEALEEILRASSINAKGAGRRSQ
jgi:CheY-like chemotaxis protein